MTFSLAKPFVDRLLSLMQLLLLTEQLRLQNRCFRNNWSFVLKVRSEYLPLTRWYLEQSKLSESVELRELCCVRHHFTNLS